RTRDHAHAPLAEFLQNLIMRNLLPGHIPHGGDPLPCAADDSQHYTAAIRAVACATYPHTMRLCSRTGSLRGNIGIYLAHDQRRQFASTCRVSTSTGRFSSA